MTIRPNEHKDPKGREGRGDRQIFLCDASAEAGRILTALQSKGYSIIDLPLGLLLSRCRHELPEVIICDADAHEAEARLRELNDLELPALKLVLFGHADGALSRAPSLRNFADATFRRPLDTEQVVAHIEAICSAPRKRSHRPRVGRPGHMPSLVAAARKPYRSDAGFFDPQVQGPEAEDSGDALWHGEGSPPSRRAPLLDRAPASERGTSPPPSSQNPQSDKSGLSSETVHVLQKGRRRLASYSKQGARPVRLSVGAHSLGGDLRPELLAALEEPLDDPEYNERWEDGPPESTSPGTKRTSSGSNRRELSGLDSSPPLSRKSSPTPSGRPSSPTTSRAEFDEKTNPGGRPGGTQPPPQGQPYDELPLKHDDGEMEDLSDLLSSPWSSPPVAPEQEDAERDKLSTTKPPRRPRTSVMSLEAADSDAALDEGEFAQAPSLPASLFTHLVDAPDNRRTEQQVSPLFGIETANELRTHGGTGSKSPLFSVLLAGMVKERSSGAVAQQEQSGVRRVVLTDGDITTVISAATNESLAYFLFARGDITKDILGTLSAIPAFGRHAGAALIARGLLQQEDLWPVLRAHAEWILGLALGSAAPSVFEGTVPQRLLDEPAVFGGSAGTEIYLEALRRVVTPAQALAALGGGSRVLGRGSHSALMGESALSARDQQAAWDAVGQPLGPVIKRQPRLLPLLFGLVQLGVLTSGGQEASVPLPEIETRNQEIEDEAFVSKLIARRKLVDDGDYFSLLGIGRSATGYEVDRARDELLMLFNETRLTPRTVHLRQDLKLLRETIEEAHLVLRDDVRRYRYRTALEAMPQSG